MNERHDITLRPAEGENPPDLLRQIVEDVKKLVPEGGKTARKWVRAKGNEAEARVREIQARVYKEIAELDIERQRLIQDRDEAWQKAELEAQRDKNAYEARLKELELQRFHEKVQALHEVVDCIVKLRDRGIEINLKVVKKVEKAISGLLDE